MPVVDPTNARLYGPLAPGFGARVEAAAKLIGDKQTAANAIDLSKDQLNKIIGEKSVPNFAAIAALAERSGCTLAWLAFGREPQLSRDALSTRKTFTGHEVGFSSEHVQSDVIYLRGYAIDGSDRLTSFPFSRHYIEQILHFSVDDVAVLEQPGDGMSPTIRARELVMIHLQQREILDGVVIAFRLAGELMVKRVQREADGAIVLLSDNQVYGPIKMVNGAGKLDVLGRVVWKAGTL